MKELEKYRVKLGQLPAGVKEAEVEAEKTVLSEASVSDGTILRMGFSEQTELFVRVTESKTGMVYTQKLDEDPVKVLEKALENSMDAENCEELNEPGEVARLIKKEGSSLRKRTEISTVSASCLSDFGKKLEKELLKKLNGVGRSMVKITQTVNTIGVVNSKGVDISGNTGRFDVTVTVSDEEEETRSYEETRSVIALEEISAEDFMEGLREWALTRLPKTDFVPGTYRAVLSSQAVTFFMVTAWQMFSAKAYQSKTTPLAEKLGQKLFSDCVTIRDYKVGCTPGSRGFQFMVDCEGTPCQDVTLVKKGTFKGLMHNLTTARAASVESTGNAGRKALLAGNIHTDMTVIPKNFTLEHGEASLEELIKKCGDGIYIYEAYDQFHSLNVVSGDFMFPCKGVMIEGGRLTGRVEGLSMNGNILDLLSRVEDIGRNSKMEPMAMYRNYEVSAPAMLVSCLRVSG